jgi:hypothetical protein
MMNAACFLPQHSPRLGHAPSSQMVLSLSDLIVFAVSK